MRRKIFTFTIIFDGVSQAIEIYALSINAAFQEKHKLRRKCNPSYGRRGSRPPRRHSRIVLPKGHAVIDTLTGGLHHGSGRGGAAGCHPLSSLSPLR